MSRVEDEAHQTLRARAQRVVQRRMVVGAQIAAQNQTSAASRACLHRVQSAAVIKCRMPAPRINLTNQFLIAMPGMATSTFAGHA
jgi:hypothetical protein